MSKVSQTKAQKLRQNTGKHFSCVYFLEKISSPVKAAICTVHAWK